MELSLRMQAVVSMLSPCRRLCDIGTDHGYVPIWALENGICKQALACDIHKGPLQKAADNIKAHGLEGRIMLRLSDGFSEVLPQEADAAVIAGMGGMLLCDILRRGQAVLQGVSQLVVQPQLDVEAVRRTLHEIGYCIAEETMVLEEEQFYTILYARPGKEQYSLIQEYMFGKLLMEKRPPVWVEYVEKEIIKMEEVLLRLAAAGTPSAGKRHRELIEKKRLYEEVLVCR